MAENPLGRATQYISQYSPELLFAIARSEKRDELDNNYLGFTGEDIWNAYELSWLNEKGLPQVAIGEFRFNAASNNIIESKSLKLYLNSFNQTRFKSMEQVQQTIKQDLSDACEMPVMVKLSAPGSFNHYQVGELEGELLDHLDVALSDYRYQPLVLENSARGNLVEETLISHLLKSNCLITSQPDWASIQIKYRGAQIDRHKLLAYLVSFRSHNEFHEQCVERIFCDIKRYCRPDKLTVYARYTRRGGLDINPWRSDFESDLANIRLARQ